MSIAIVGDGAIGGFLGVRLVKAGEDITFIARSNAEAIRSHDLAFEGDERGPILWLLRYESWSSPPSTPACRP